MFKITQAKGFHMTFDNKWTISVQWGPGNYADNRHLHDTKPNLESKTAEVAIFNAAGDFVKIPVSLGGEEHDTVAAYMGADQVLAIMNWVAARA